MYPEELLELQQCIIERRRSNYAMLLAISHNPHSQKPEGLWDSLRGEQHDYIDAPFDREGMTALKARLGLKREQ